MFVKRSGRKSLKKFETPKVNIVVGRAVTGSTELEASISTVASSAVVDWVFVGGMLVVVGRRKSLLLLIVVADFGTFKLAKVEPKGIFS